MIDLTAPLEHTPLVFLDVETTGLDPRGGDRVCEVALLRCQGDATWAFESLVNPQRALSASAARVNGIAAAELASAPTFAAVAPEVLALLEGALLVAHNAGFDMLFLNSELARLDLPALDQPVVDTLAVARKLLRRSSYSLGNLARAYGVPAPTHRAMSDVRALRLVFGFLLDELRALGITTLADLLRYQRGLLPHEPEPQAPELISVAIRERRRLRLRYHGASSVTPSDREVEPIELVIERGALSLRAFCFLRNDLRTFLIARIESLELL